MCRSSGDASSPPPAVLGAISLWGVHNPTVAIRRAWLVVSLGLFVLSGVAAILLPRLLWCNPDMPFGCLSSTPWGWIQLGVLIEGVLGATLVFLLARRHVASLTYVLVVMLVMAGAMSVAIHTDHGTPVGWSSPVDVPLSVTVLPARAGSPACSTISAYDKKLLATCQVQVSITNPGDMAVYAFNCVAQALDAKGKLLFQGRLASGLQGFYVPAGSGSGGAQTTNIKVFGVPRSAAGAAERFTAHCQAVLWYGQAPV